MTSTADPRGTLDRFFGISERGSSVRTEVIAGATTFMTMAYILFVNPVILGKVADAAGNRLPFAAVLTSTALVAALATIAMGLLANLPLALAAGMGLNSVVAFQLVATMHLTWPQAMGVVVAEGLAVTVLVLSGFRRAVSEAVPLGMKRALGIGIGLFLTIIGFVEAGFVSRSPVGPVPVTLGRAGHLAGFPDEADLAAGEKGTHDRSLPDGKAFGVYRGGKALIGLGLETGVVVGLRGPGGGVSLSPGSPTVRAAVPGRPPELPSHQRGRDDAAVDAGGV